MKFKFSGLSSYEEKEMPNFMGEAESHTVIKEFDSMEQAVQHVAAHSGFMVTDCGKFAFHVRTITQVD